MKKGKTVGIILLAAVIAVYLGIFVFRTSQRDSMKLIEAGMRAGNQVAADFELRLGKKVGGITLTAELWQKGVCEKSEPFFVDTQAKKLNIRAFVNPSDTEDEPGRLDVQIDTDTEAWAMNAQFEPTAKWMGYGFKSLGEKETLLALPGGEAVLAAIAFDVGGGVRSMDCRAYAQRPERVEEEACLLLVRAVFSGK